MQRCLACASRFAQMRPLRVWQLPHQHQHQHRLLHLRVRPQQIRRCHSESSGSETFLQRIWRTYKTQTQIVFAVHIAGSIVWFSGLYYLISSRDINLPNTLRRYLPKSIMDRFPESAMDTLSNPSVGAVAATLIVYKLLFPIRDLCTILLTPITLSLLRRFGMIARVKHEDRLRNITKEKGKETYQKLSQKARQS